MNAMLSVDAARTKLTKLISPVSEEERVPLDAAGGRAIARDIYAPLDLPPFKSSAMDGYALRSMDCNDSGTTRLLCVGTSRAGTPFHGTVGEGETVRIFTGAEVPKDCDAVVLQEDVDRRDQTISFKTSVNSRLNVRERGNDVTEGELIGNKGDLVDPYLIGWLAACGISTIPVKRKINVAVFSTGDELQDPGKPLNRGQIYDSNRQLLCQLLIQKPVTTVDLGRLPDDASKIEHALFEAEDQADIVITTGGVSVGDADFVRPVIEKIGQLDFWNIALKPGKPLAVGTIGNSLFMGLPGNPVSTIVTYLLFVAPAIDQFSGVHSGTPYEFTAKLTNDLKHSLGRREYQRGVFEIKQDEILVTSVSDQGSNRLSSMSRANCLIVVPESVESLNAGTNVQIVLLPKVASHLWGSQD